MIGVASRKPKRRGVGVVEAAGQPGGHAHAVAADPGDQRGRLRDADHARLAVLERVELAAAVALQCPRGPPARAPRRAGAALGAEQDAAVDRSGRSPRPAAWPRHAQPCARAASPRIPTGMLAQMISQARRSVGVSIAALAQRGEERLDDRDPVPPEVDQQADRAADVEHHHERQPRRLGLRLPGDDVVPAEQVSGTAPCGRGSRPGTAR